MDFTIDLSDILFKYERMQSLISVLQQFTAECVEVAGAPENALSDALYEIELGLGEANEQMKAVLERR
ncbi:MAG: hypothetical protein HFH11_12515 [Dorea sp.]|jgi:hypothetical protein|nr:hypothetical protein [Dorea sp.]